MGLENTPEHDAIPAPLDLQAEQAWNDTASLCTVKLRESEAKNA
jgi:hypothetical protein